MLVTFPRSIMLDPSGFGDMNQLLTFGLDGPGLNGLGQGMCDDGEGNLVPCTSPIVSFPPVTLPLPASNPTALGSDIYTPPAQTACVGVNCGAPAAVSSSSGSTAAQDIAALGPALTAASKALSVATGPYQIPGTGYIYNPATGQILMGGTAVGTYNPATGVASALTSSLLSYLPLILIAVVGMSFLGGKK